jgi:hypothetical protein
MVGFLLYLATEGSGWGTGAEVIYREVRKGIIHCVESH